MRGRIKGAARVEAERLAYDGRCSALPNGTTPTATGDKIILRWIDKTGAVSADSKPIVVATAK